MATETDITAQIVVIEDSSGKTEVKINMPVWIRHGKGNDKNIYAKLPVFGLETHGTSMSDLDVAIEEAITCFFKAAVKFGNGIDKELNAIGWKKVEETKKILAQRKRTAITAKALSRSRHTVHHAARYPIFYNVPDSTPMFSEMIKTGEHKELCVRI